MKAVDVWVCICWFHCDKYIYLYLNSNDGRVIMIRAEGGPNKVGEDVTWSRFLQCKRQYSRFAFSLGDKAVTSTHVACAMQSYLIMFYFIPNE